MSKNFNLQELAASLTPDQIKELARNAGVSVGQGMSQETKDKIANALRGRKMPEDQRKKLSDAMMNKVQSPEAKARQSASMKEHYRIVARQRQLLSDMVRALQNGTGYEEWVKQLREEDRAIVEANR